MFELISKLLTPKVPKEIWAPCFFSLFIIAGYYFIEQILRPTAYDASGYLSIARSYNENGILETKESLRTFFYPWILSQLMRASNLLILPSNLIIFVFQLFVHIACISIVTNIYSRHSDSIVKIMLPALSLNIFVIPYIGITLTDSIFNSLACAIFGWIAACELYQKAQPIEEANWLSYIGISLLCFAIVLRPAGIFLFPPVALILFRLVSCRRVSWQGFTISVAVGVLILLIQVTLSSFNFHKVSFFPIIDLSSFQLATGIKNIKYGTWMGVGGPQNFYTSSNLINIDFNNLNLLWYLKNPSDGVTLIFYKLIAGFDFDYLVPYPYKREALGWGPSLISLSILWVGLVGIAFHALTGRIAMMGSRWMPLIVFVSWSSINLLSAIECRFVLPMLTYFLIVSVIFLSYLWGEKKYIKIAFLGSYVLLILLFINAASFIRDQSSIIQNIN